MNRESNEEKAFEAFVVSAYRSYIPEVSDEELDDPQVRRVAKKIGDDFVERFMRGETGLDRTAGNSEAATEQLELSGECLYRSEDVDEKTSNELDEIDGEVLRKKQEEGEADRDKET